MESSPAVGGDAVFIGDADGVLHAVNVRDGRGLWTFKTTSEIKSSPVVVDTMVLIGSYDGHLYALDAANGRVRWKTETDGPVHATPSVQDGIAYLAGCDEHFRAIRVSDGKELFKIPRRREHSCIACPEGDRAYVGTFNSEVIAIDLTAKRVAWRYQNPDRQFPFYSSAALAGPADCRRAGQVGSRHRQGDRQGVVELRDARARGFVAGGCRRSRLRRVERWTPVRARPRHRAEAVGVRCGRSNHGVACDRRRTRRDWSLAHAITDCFGRVVLRSSFVVRRDRCCAVRGCCSPFAHAERSTSHAARRTEHVERPRIVERSTSTEARRTEHGARRAEHVCGARRTSSVERSTSHGSRSRRGNTSTEHGARRTDMSNVERSTPHVARRTKNVERLHVNCPAAARTGDVWDGCCSSSGPWSRGVSTVPCSIKGRRSSAIR